MSPKPFLCAELSEGLKTTLEGRLGAGISQSQPLSCNDWNCTFRMQAGEDAYFLKTYKAEELAQQEAQGLLAIKKSKTVRVPEVAGWGPDYLILEWIDAGAEVNWPRLGEGLAAMHRHNNRVFGWSHLNYIGSLPQYNGVRPTWGAFFIDQRLMAQLRLAQQRGSLAPELMARLLGFLPKAAKLVEVKEKPALLHGDLWRGNVMAAADGEPILVDPAVYYGSREVDLAFSELFGGFPAAFYDSYKAAFPLLAGYDQRRDVLNLYYLLVHANLFGAPYPAQIEALLIRLEG